MDMKRAAESDNLKMLRRHCADVKAAGWLIVGSAPEMMSRIYDMAPEALAPIFGDLYLEEIGIYSHTHSIVALDDDGSPVGLAICFDYDEHYDESDYTASCMLNLLGRDRFAKALMNLREMDGTCGVYPDDALYVANVSVEPEKRGKGVGRQMFAAIERWAKDLGKRRVALDVELSNAAGIRFYDSIGFKRIAVRDFAGKDIARFTAGFAYFEKLVEPK